MDNNSLVAIVAALVGGIEMRLAMHRMARRLHRIERRVSAVETPKPDPWLDPATKYPTVAARGAGLLLLAAIALGTCGCKVRVAPVGDIVAAAEKGGAAGFAIGGPQGALIGSAGAAILAAFVRNREKNAMRRRGVLIDNRPKQQSFLDTESGA